MYEAIAGRPPFVGTAFLQTLNRHSTEEPVPPSVVQRRAMPVGLEAIVLRCLAKRPQDRYQSALELKRKLDKADLRTVGRRAKDRWSLAFVTCIVLAAAASIVVHQLDRMMSHTEEYIRAQENPAWVRFLITCARTRPQFNTRNLAALYCRLIDLEGDNHIAAMKDGMEAYEQLVDPQLKDDSFTPGK